MDGSEAAIYGILTCWVLSAGILVRLAGESFATCSLAAHPCASRLAYSPWAFNGRRIVFFQVIASFQGSQDYYGLAVGWLGFVRSR